MRSPPWTRSSARPIPRRPTPARSRPSPPRLGRYRKGPRLTAMSGWRTLRPLLRRPVRAERPVCEHAGVGTTNEIPRRVNGAGRWHSTFSVHSNSRVSGPFRNRSGSSVHPGGRHPWFRQMCSMLAPLTASQTVLVNAGRSSTSPRRSGSDLVWKRRANSTMHRRNSSSGLQPSSTALATDDVTLPSSASAEGSRGISASPCGCRSRRSGRVSRARPSRSAVRSAAVRRCSS